MVKRRGLKPCPWCGSGPILRKDKLWSEHSYNGHTTTHGYVGAYHYYYICSNEDCEAIAPHGKYDTIYHSEDEAKLLAREAWNGRTDDEDT